MKKSAWRGIRKIIFKFWDKTIKKLMAKRLKTNGHRKEFINFDVFKNSRKDAEAQRIRKEKFKNATEKNAFLGAAFATLRDKIKKGRDSRIYRMNRIRSVFAFNNFDSNHFDFNFLGQDDKKNQCQNYLGQNN